LTAPCSTHGHVVMKFPGEPIRVENKQIKFILAAVFLCRLVIDQRALNLVLIALNADIFFMIISVIGRNYSFHCAMFGLFGDADVDVTNGRAIGVEVSVEADPLLSPGSNEAGERLRL